jgi:hypothetical protein
MSYFWYGAGRGPLHLIDQREQAGQRRVVERYALSGSASLGPRLPLWIEQQPGGGLGLDRWWVECSGCGGDAVGPGPLVTETGSKIITSWKNLLSR